MLKTHTSPLPPPPHTHTHVILWWPGEGSNQSLRSRSCTGSRGWHQRRAPALSRPSGAAASKKQPRRLNKNPTASFSAASRGSRKWPRHHRLTRPERSSGTEVPPVSSWTTGGAARDPAAIPANGDEGQCRAGQCVVFVKCVV